MLCNRGSIAMTRRSARELLSRKRSRYRIRECGILVALDCAEGLLKAYQLTLIERGAVV